MKSTQIILMLTMSLMFPIASGFTAEVATVMQTLDADDSLTVFDKMQNMKRIRETTGSGRELEHRLFISSDKALTLHCVAFVSASGDFFLAQTCKVIIKSHLSKSEITAISRIAEGQGILVEFKDFKDNSLLLNQFLVRMSSFYSAETIDIKIGSKVKMVPVFALRCKSTPTIICHMSLFHLDN